MGVASKILKKSAGVDGKLGWGTALNVGIGGMFAISEYNDSREEGSGVIGSALSAAGDFAISNMVGVVPYMAMSVIPTVAEGAVDAYDAINQYGRSLDRMSTGTPFMNSTFVDTQQTYTMRQAGMNLAKQSKYNIQQAMLGDEARMTYR